MVKKSHGGREVLTVWLLSLLSFVPILAPFAVDLMSEDANSFDHFLGRLQSADLMWSMVGQLLAATAGSLFVGRTRLSAVSVGMAVVNFLFAAIFMTAGLQFEAANSGAVKMMLGFAVSGVLCSAVLCLWVYRDSGGRPFEEVRRIFQREKQGKQAD